MEVPLTPDQQAFIQRAVNTGRYSSAEEALRDVLARWEDDERARFELLAAFDEAESDLNVGAFTDHTNDTLAQLADDLKREARAARDTRPA